jgi:O-antigen/teichoic acid export membrane protein
VFRSRSKEYGIIRSALSEGSRFVTGEIAMTMRVEVETKAEDRHLRVAQLNAGLKQRAVRSGALVIAAQIGCAVIAIAAVAVLARLLRPTDFGLIAMAFPIVVIATVLRNFGLDIGIINREQLDAALVNSIFWLSLRLNFLMALALAAIAPALAWFYREPRLIGVTLALASGVFVLSLGAQHETLLKRQMRFDLLSATNVLSTLAGAIAAVVSALLGAGYWSLVIQTVVTFSVRSLLAWMICDWRPLWKHAPSGEFDNTLRSMRASGRNLTGTRVLTLASNYFDRVIVGWLAGASVLGLYENGRRLAFFAVDALYSPLLDVAVAGFSRTGRDDARYRSFAIKSVQLVLAMMLPVLAFIFVEAGPVTSLLLGAQWTGTIPFARLLAAAAFAQSLTRILTWFYLSRNETARQVRWFALQTVVIFAAICVGAWRDGPRGVAWGLAAATCLLTIPAIVYGLSQSPFRARDFARAAVGPILISLGAAAILWLAESLWHWPRQTSIHCVIAFGTYILIYASLWMALPGGRATAWQMIRLLLES